MSELRPDGTSPPTDDYVVEQIRDALATDSRVNELELKVEILGRDVYVSGTVNTPERRAAVTDVIAGVVPDRRIHNHTTVPSLAGETESEQIA
jgi:osmotically-inducible protein OsmY